MSASSSYFTLETCSNLIAMLQLKKVTYRGPPGATYGEGGGGGGFSSCIGVMVPLGCADVYIILNRSSLKQWCLFYNS